jgi:hypothetical protein
VPLHYWRTWYSPTAGLAINLEHTKSVWWCWGVERNRREHGEEVGTQPAYDGYVSCQSVTHSLAQNFMRTGWGTVAYEPHEDREVNLLFRFRGSITHLLYLWYNLIISSTKISENYLTVYPLKYQQYLYESTIYNHSLNSTWSPTNLKKLIKQYKML